MKITCLLNFCWIASTGLVCAGSPEFILLSSDNNTLYRSSLALGAPKLIGKVEQGSDLVELIEADAVRLYAFERVSNSLLVLDRFDGSVLAERPLDQDVWVTRRGFDLSPSSVLYGVLPGMQLRRIDPTTGATRLVSNITGAARVEAIAFSPDGTLYASGSIADNQSSETLFKLSTRTGVLTPVGQMGSYDVDDLTFGPDGYLYGVDSVNDQNTRLLRIDPATASVTDLGPTGVTGVTGLVAVRQHVRLSISAGKTSIQVRWPTSALGFRLEQTSTLRASDWSPVEIVPQVEGTELVISVPRLHSKQFFRLAR